MGKHNILNNEYLKLLARKIKYSNLFIGLRLFYEALSNSSNLRVINAQITKEPPSLEEAINIFSQRWPNVKSNSDAEPIFIFSAGWRSGSTLLQRLISSSGDIIIWGEPYGHTGIIEHLSQPIRSVTSNYPCNNFFISDIYGNNESLSSLSEKWIANLNPDVNYLLKSQISFMTELFENPAKDQGATRWGIKEVRLTIDHAIYLNWLFPKAKFLFLYRNPYDAYVSYQQRGKYVVWPYDYWYNKWPYEPINTPHSFGLHWKNLLAGYLSGYQKVKGMLIKYEDLCDGNLDFDALEKLVNLKLDKSLLQVKIKGNNQENSYQITENHLLALKETVEPLASKVGYEI